MDNDIQLLIEKTALSYGRMLDVFRPCRLGGEFLEQNLITILSSEFLKQNPDGIAFSEIPFINRDEPSKWSSRIDAYLATKETGYLVEAKGSQSKGDLFSLISADIKRLKSKELETSFEQMANDRDSSLPKTMKGIIIADCWSKPAVEDWGNIDKISKKYPQLASLNTCSFKVGDYGKYSYFIIAGQIKDDLFAN